MLLDCYHGVCWVIYKALLDGFYVVAGVLLRYSYDVARRLPGCRMWLLSCYCLLCV